MEVKNSSVENTLESMPFAHLPLLVYYLESEVFIWRSCAESNNKSVRSVRRFQEVLRCLSFFNQIRVKDVEFVPLHCFGRRIIDIVVSLIVLVPFIPRLDCVEESWFPRFILIFPCILLYRHFWISIPTKKNIGKFFFILAHTFFFELFVHIY